MSLEQLMVDKLVELAARPTRDDLAKAQANATHLQAMTMRQGEEIAKMRERERKADAPLTELWQAAEALLKAMPKTQSNPKYLGAYERLHAALKASSPFVDQIPF